LNSEPPEYEAEALTLRPRLSVQLSKNIVKPLQEQNVAVPKLRRLSVYQLDAQGFLMALHAGHALKKLEYGFLFVNHHFTDVARSFIYGKAKGLQTL
jgi:hypothetical protein